MKLYSRSMSSLAILAVAILGCSDGGGRGASVKLQGAGATFPAPLYNKWFKEYSTAHPDLQIDYQMAGSGKGVKMVIDKTVDFGASDAGMTPEEIAQVDGGVQLLPMTAGSIVLAYNLDGVDALKLSREAYAGIFLSKVTKWNDPLIAKANPGVTLPASDVHVVVRADGSGTTYVFTQHLGAIDEDFAADPGVSKNPNWKVGTQSKGNDGVANSLHTTPGSIGYIEYSYAIGAKLKMASLENKAGKFVAPTIASTQAALASVEMPEDLVAWIPDPSGDESYPIVTYTWIIAYRHYADAAKGQALKDVLKHCLTKGQSESEKLFYAPLPAEVSAKAVAALDNIEVAAASNKTN
jgi:phosphate transport system substrate-binding protein